MIPLSKYAVVGPDASLKNAVTVLRKSHCQLDKGICTEAGPRTVLVVNQKNDLMGISEKLRSLQVSIVFAERDIPELDEAHADFVARVRMAKDVMLKVRGTIEANATLLDGLKLLFKNKINKLPVYDNGNLVGIVRDTDLFLAVAEILAES